MYIAGFINCSHCDKPICEKITDEHDTYYEEYCKVCFMLRWKINKKHEIEILNFNKAGIKRHNAYIKRINGEFKN